MYASHTITEWTRVSQVCVLYLYVCIIFVCVCPT